MYFHLKGLPIVNLLVERDTYRSYSTEGTLYVDGEHQCYTLELPLGDGLPGSAVPEGTYSVGVYPSPHFGRLMPLLSGIPGRSDIEIHWGNYPDNTRGCILLGSERELNFVSDSRKAFDDFWAKAQGPMERGDCTIQIKNLPEETST
jgi:Family of unknown function (DUF5675)